MANIKKRISRKLHKTVKDIYQEAFTKSCDVKNILFILGCQRSGTTLMTEIFDKDLKVKVYEEFSELSSLDKYNIRLNPYNLVREEIDSNKVSSIVLKPLVESQHTLKLLNYFEDSRGLWMFRHYRDVSASNLKHFGKQNGIDNLRPIINKTSGNWRSDNISQSTYQLVQKYYAEDMQPYDAAALFWYVRNNLFFELNLRHNQRIMMCKYEDLVTSPLRMMQNIYSFSGFKFPGAEIVANVHSKSVNKGNKVSLTPAIENLCENMLEKLNVVYEEKIKSL